MTRTLRLMLPRGDEFPRPPGGSLPQTLKRTPATTTGAWDPVRYSGCVSENGRIAERWLVWSRAGRAQSHLLDLTRAERLRPRHPVPTGRPTRPRGAGE